jgi:hypothetical protein
MTTINIGTISGDNNQVGETNTMTIHNAFKEHEAEISKIIEAYHRSAEEKAQLENSLAELKSNQPDKSRAAGTILKFIKDVGIELAAVITVTWLESIAGKR